MNLNVLSLSTSNTILLVLAVIIIFSRLVAVFTIKKLPGERTDTLKLGVLFQYQPWLIALLIIVAFAAGYFLIESNVLSLTAKATRIIEKALGVICAGLNLYLFIKEARAIYLWLSAFATEKNSLLSILLPNIKKTLYYISIILALPFILPDFVAYPELAYITEKVTTILIIWAIACAIIQFLSALEKAVLQRYGDVVTQSFEARRIYTQVRVFRRVAILVVIVLAIIATVTAFENIREIGTSILASAGLASVILGFAAQKTLGNLFAGIQIALTQPIRINDTIIIENEFGTVEEISLTHVVLKVWDLRRLIIPITYFIEKPFQNLTRTSTELLCPIFLYADYNVPVESLRQKLMEILRASAFWDGKVGILQVVEAEGNVLKLRVLASVRNSGDSWNLKCEVLEKLIEFMVTAYPQCLPKLRNTLENLKNQSASEKL